MKVFGVVVITILLVAGLSALEAGIFMALWNWIAVSLFAAPELDFWVAWGFWALIMMIGAAFKSTVTTTTKKD